MVEGRGSRVTSRGSSVNGRGSRVTSRGSKNSSQLFLNVVKSKFHIGLCLRSVGACLNELAEVLKAKIREVDTLLEQMRSQAKNKQSESYAVVLSDPLEIREEGKRNETDNKADKSRKRLERRKWKSKNVFKTILSHASIISKTCHRETEIEKTKLPCLNRRHQPLHEEESITTVCKAYEEFYHKNPLIPTSYYSQGHPTTVFSQML